MRRSWVIIVAVVLVLAGVMIAAAVHFARARSPHVILARLRAGKGDRTELLMRLQLARGDVLSPMLAAAQDRQAPVAFRCDMVEALFKQHGRQSDPRILETMRQLRRDPDPQIRRRVVYGYAVYGSERLQATLTNQLTDSDPEVRKQIYLLLVALRSKREVESGMWSELTDEQKRQVVAMARQAADQETDPDLQHLARSVVGRQIEILGRQADRARERAETDEAERLLKQALALDPQHHQAQVRLIRHYLAVEDEARAVELAEQSKALLKIPRLSAAPVIDGDPTESAWQDAYSGERFFLTVARFAARPAKGRTRFSIGHHDGRIYIAILGYEDDLDELHVTHLEDYSEIWRDDCVEIYLGHNVSSGCYVFMMNAGGAIGTSQRDIQTEYAAGVFKNRGYWCCEFSVSAKDLTKDGITADSIWGVNIVRARIGGAAEHCQWWPTFGWAHHYHLFPIAMFETE